MIIEQLPDGRKAPMNRAERLTIAVTGAALFMVVLDNLIVASTLPAIQRSLGASLGSLEWVLNAYILAFAVLMLTAAALGERYGRRRVFTAGVVLFTVSSAAGALAPSAGTLIAARAIEGIGGAVIMPLTLTMMTAAFPAARRGAGHLVGHLGLRRGARPGRRRPADRRALVALDLLGQRPDRHRRRARRPARARGGPRHLRAARPYRRGAGERRP